MTSFERDPARVGRVSEEEGRVDADVVAEAGLDTVPPGDFSFGAGVAGPGDRAVSFGEAPDPVEALGAAPDHTESVGPAFGATESVGPAPEPAETIGAGIGAGEPESFEFVTAIERAVTALHDSLQESFRQIQDSVGDDQDSFSHADEAHGRGTGPDDAGMVIGETGGADSVPIEG